MLKIGTKVFITRFLHSYRSYSSGCEEDLVGCYGEVEYSNTNSYGEIYYKVSVTDTKVNKTLLGYFHEYELVDLGSDWPKYRIGDTMRICNISEREKRQYPVG